MGLPLLALDHNGNGSLQQCCRLLPLKLPCLAACCRCPSPPSLPPSLPVAVPHCLPMPVPSPHSLSPSHIAWQSSSSALMPHSACCRSGSCVGPAWDRAGSPSSCCSAASLSSVACRAGALAVLKLSLRPHTHDSRAGGWAEQRRAEGEMDSHETHHHRHCLPHHHPSLYKHSQHSCPAHTHTLPVLPPASCHPPAVIQCCWVKVGPHNRRQLHCCRVGECGAMHLLGNRPQEVKALAVGQHSTQRSKVGPRGSRGREERSSYCCWCRWCCWCCWCLTLLVWLTLHPRLC